MSNSVVGERQEVGNPSGGEVYTAHGWLAGKRIEKIGAWKTGSRIKAMRLWLTGEHIGQTFGNPDGEYREFSFKPGERITSMSLWPGNWNDIPGNRFGNIKFTTDQGNTFDFGERCVREYPIDYYSGILVGADIRAGADINSVAFYFLRDILHCQLKDVTYPDIESLGGIVPLTLDSLRQTNNTKNEMQWKLEGSREYTVSSSWSVTDVLSVGMSISVSAGIPEVVDVSMEVKWDVSHSATREQSWSDKRVLSWSVNSVLKPGESVSAKALSQRGTTTNLPYTGKMSIKLDNGATFEYPVKGTYTGICVTDVRIVYD